MSSNYNLVENKMKVLITGAAGFIGSFLSRALLDSGNNVIGIDNFHDYYPKRAKEFNLDLTRISIDDKLETTKISELEPILRKLESYKTRKFNIEKGDFTFYEVDIRDEKKLKDIFKKHKIDKIVHLAAMAGVPYSLENPKLYCDVNINGTVNLLDLSVKYKVKNFIFASSSSVYGTTKEIPFRETQNVDNPISPYAATKRMGEIMCYTYNYLHKLPITCLRFFTVYGPLQRPYGMAIQKFIKLTYHDKPMTIYGDGKMARDYTYIADIVNGITEALEGKFEYEIFNLGNTETTTVNELAALIMKYMKKGETKNVPKPKTEVPITYSDISKAKKELNYDPKITFKEGLERQIEVFNLMPEWYKKLPE